MKNPNSIEALQKSFSKEIHSMEIKNNNEVYFKIEKKALPSIAAFLHSDSSCPLTNIVGTDERIRDGMFKLYVVFSDDRRDLFIILQVGLEANHPEYPSITPFIHAASWYERENQDLFGIKPLGHPYPFPLVPHFPWPEGYFPLRKDFDPKKSPGKEKDDWSPPPVSGEGVFEIPVGPVHAGIIEPGHFRFSVVGETVLNLAARLFYKHRGIEKRAEGKTFLETLFLVERISGVGSFSHSTAYCQALERLAGISVPLRAAYLRTLFLEMERLYNHIGDVGNLCAGTGLIVGIAQGAILKERLMRLNMNIAGHRYLFGINKPGGVRKDISSNHILEVSTKLEHMEKDFSDLVRLILASSSNLDRLEGTGVLNQTTARDHSAVGPAGRASGIDRDCRRDHPHAAYNKVTFSIPVYPDGDVLARLKVRVDEARQSFGIIRQILQNLPPGPIETDLPSISPYQTGMGYTESPRGEVVHWVMTGPDQTTFRLKVRSPSFCNWHVVPETIPGNIVPDFPLINKSFELSYAGCDR